MVKTYLDTKVNFAAENRSTLKKLGYIPGCLSFLLLFNNDLEVLANAIRQEK